VTLRRADLSDPEFEHFPDDPPGFRSSIARFGRVLGAKSTGASLYHLPPGEALCPYHYEYGEEEWALVLEGQATVRTPAGSEQIGPMELLFFPCGPEGAHQILNDTDEPVRVLMWSNVVLPTATAYPDSGKVGVWTGDKAEDLMVKRSSGVEYFEGESR
jgi:uncharacterized cupin superfamily protein